MTRRLAVAIVLAAAVLPRLAVLLVERGEILAALVEKSDRFAQTLVASGTFGFLPGRPSGYTQPLYAWFLAGLYQVFERHWLVVGVAHIVLAALTSLVVLEIGRRVVSLQVGVVGATIATLHPFLVWHDMHLNREVLDGLLLAVVTLLAVLAVERASKLQLVTSSVSGPAAGKASKLQVATRSVLALALALGVALGLAILGNARLALLPLALAAYVAWPFEPLGRSFAAAGLVLVGAILVVTPWMARNEASVGCFVLTTDTRALWKANNANTYETLDRGDWIDDVPEPPNGPPWPELAADRTLAGMPTEIDECEQQRYYRELVFDFWREEPEEKARLSAQAVRMLWSPTFSVDSDDGGGGRVAELGRDVVEPVYMVAVYVLAFGGAFFVPRRFLALVLLLEAYSTLAAMAFAGTVRYRAPFDFLLALLAAAAIARILEWRRTRRTEARA
jgi:4-amino-4-deoxy-L-arabinose transferase-like glycosyltransferase